MESTTDTGSWKNSDATITYFARGRNILMSDSGGFSAPPMIATYSRSDSLFCIFARCIYDGSNMISFVLQMPPDTGQTTLNFPAIRFYYDTVDRYPNSRSGNALIYFSDGAWSTDVNHTGTIDITDFDTVKHTFDARFAFRALDTSKESSNTVAVDSGIISQMPFQIN